jgi:dolichol-phosphate mannosyltransferase
MPKARGTEGGLGGATSAATTKTAKAAVAMRLLTAIPVYNEAAHIEPVLRAVLAAAHDVLVVDDGSTDGTAQKLREFPTIQVIRHPRNRGYGAGLKSAFERAIDGGYDGLVTLDCDGQHEPVRIPEIAAPLDEFDIVSGSRYLKVFDPTQAPPPERRWINMEVTRWLNECLGFQLTDAFCGFKAYRTSALRQFEIVDEGYAMPLEVWVQAAAHRMSIVEVPVPLIYLDEARAFGGALDDASFRLSHYKAVFQKAIERAGLAVAGECR